MSDEVVGGRGTRGAGRHEIAESRRECLTVSNTAEKHENAKYEVNLDGDIRPWFEPTITVAQIRELAGWAADQPVVIVDLKTNDERDLAEDDVVDLKPGHGFSKKIKFKRGAR